MHLSMHLWLCVFVVSPGRWFFRLKSSLWSYPWPIRSKYGLFTYMNGEKWPHSRGKWLGKYSRPMDVSENNGTPKSSIFIGFSIINHPFWGTLIFGNTHMDPMGHGFHPRPLRFQDTTTTSMKVPTASWTRTSMDSGPIGPTKSLKVSFLRMIGPSYRGV